MSTRAIIGVQIEENAIVAVYCHHDGYPSWLGKTLLENYKGLKVWELIALGDMSSCGTTLEECNPYSEWERNYYEYPRFHHNVEEIYRGQCDAEYVYIYNQDENKWYYHDSHKNKDNFDLTELTMEICESDY